MIHVYSGSCRLCQCGELTDLIDSKDEKLYTGDIVIVYQDGYIVNHLSVVVRNQYPSYSDGSFKLIDKKGYFIMGIKDTFDSWLVIKVKNYRDVINGEHWAAFGFNYREELQENV